MMYTVKIVTLWTIASTLVHHSLAKPMPEPVMMDIAKAMIPQEREHCFRSFPLSFSLGGALLRIFAPTIYENRIKICL